MTMTTTTKLRSLRVRITVWVALLATIGLVSTGIITWLAVVQQIRDRIDDTLAREISEFRELSDRHPELDINSLLHKSMAENVGDDHETFLGVLPDSTIAPVEGSQELPLDRGFRRKILAHETPGYGTYRSPKHGEIRYAVMPIVEPRGADAAQTAQFVVAYFVSKELSDMRRVTFTYAIAGTIALIAIAGAAWLTSSSILTPLRNLRDTAQQFSATNTAERITVQGNDEVADLAITFNNMLDRLSDALDAQRNMLDDVGHELRTPITIVRGNLELVDVNDPADIETTRDLSIDELDRMNELVNDMITLSKSRRPDFLNLEPINLADIVSDTLARYRRTNESSVTFETDRISDAWISGDRNRILQAAIQLVDNAIKVTSDGTISLGCERIGRSCRFWVSDTGPGIDLPDPNEVFERHTRATDIYDGTGLGLAIVAAISRAHGGTCEVTSTSPAGTTMTIDIPATRPEDGRSRKGVREA